MNLSEKMLYHLRKQYKGNNTQIFLSLLFRDVFLMRRNKIYNVSVKSYVEIKSPWESLLTSKLKYWVVVPPFIHMRVDLLIKFLSM